MLLKNNGNFKLNQPYKTSNLKKISPSKVCKQNHTKKKKNTHKKKRKIKNQKARLAVPCGPFGSLICIDPRQMILPDRLKTNSLQFPVAVSFLQPYKHQI